MNKQEFLLKLKKGLSGLPKADIEERLNFYAEMIDDRMEEGFSEEDSISQIGSVEKIVSQILSDIPFSKLVKEKVKPKKAVSILEIILLVLGSPIWLSVMIALLAVIFAFYIIILSIIVSVWAIEVSLFACMLGALISSAVFAFTSNFFTSVAMLGAGLVCAALSIYLFFLCKSVTKGIFILTKKIIISIKSLFIGKEKAK